MPRPLLGAAIALGIAVATLLWQASASSSVATAQSIEAREGAYRANNLGVARLEQYDFPAAIAEFRRALELDAQLAMARLNLGIALFYAGEPGPARKEIEAARPDLPERPHPDYVLGLIARSEDRAPEALEAFSRVRKLDPTDVGSAINLGQLHLQERRYPEALESFRVATRAEPYNATAAYGLATALLRSGAAEEGRAAMARFEQLRDSSYATTFSQTYLEQGRYAEAIASTGAEPALVNERTPEVSFQDVTADLISASQAAPPAASTDTGAVALIDLDGDGDLDLAEAGGSNLRILRNDSGRFSDATAAWFGGTEVPGASGIVAGDYDNDTLVDLLVLRANGLSLYRQQPAGRFTDATAKSGIAFAGRAATAAWLDVDHDGDLDLFLGGAASGNAPGMRLFRNNGDGTFADHTTAAGFSHPATVVASVPTDYDNRRDIDVLVVPSEGNPLLFRNLRDGSFRDVAGDVGLAAGGAHSMAAVADVNKDGYVDAFFASPSGAGSMATSDGRGRYATEAAPQGAANARAAQFIDYDNDGLLDLVVVTAEGPRLFRGLGQRWEDVSARAFAGLSSAAGFGSLASGDLDGDGDIDIVVRGRSALAIWRNDGASGARSLRVRLQARVSNRSAVGSKVEMRAGSLRHRQETYAATPSPAPSQVLFGFGDRPGADVVRVLWPSGILQAESSTEPIEGILPIEELDRKPSSCPFLYTWTGDRFEFLTDFLGGGEMGYWLAPGVRNTPDPDEYIRIPGDRLRAKDGRYELRITNELEEAVFLDRVQLLAVTHRPDVAVHPNEGLRSTPEPLNLFGARDARPPVAAVDEHGHDVLDRISRVDRQYPDDFALEPIRGYAAPHSLTLTLPPGDRRILLLTGWTDYAFSGDNVAAHQRGLAMSPPSLQVRGALTRNDSDRHEWRTVIDEIGFPVGRPQTVVVDLAGKVRPDEQVVRIVTNMRIYWDQVLVGSSDPSARMDVVRIDPAGATLRWRGFSREWTPDGREPFDYAYDEVTPYSPWKLMPGRYTREGDVLELLTTVDDRFVVARPGDEIAVDFGEAALGPVPPGLARTFLLYADGFSKEMDLNSSSPDTLEPLPFHGMRQYPYPASEAPPPTASQRDYHERFNTRIVPRPIPPLEVSAPMALTPPPSQQGSRR